MMTLPRAAERREPEEQSELVTVWAALADPTRRRILDLLRERPHTTGALADEFPSSRFAVMKHLKVLESAELIIVRREGRERWNHLNVVPLQLLYDRWVKPYQAIWAQKMADLKRQLEGETMKARSVTVEEAELQITIAAAPERVWKALTEETTFWWAKDFYTSERTLGVHMETKLGGKLYEDYGNGAGAVWYEIFALHPPHSIDLKGNLAVPYGPALSLLHLELKAEGKGTILRLSDSTFGVSKDGVEGKIDGWRQLFEVGLKGYVEGQRGGSD
ncbi:MAG: metalloregulator ArsR/SmtB family transcription factor [Bryobacterales bacterium]|nr:metalloregulator ArsR/SmtB family transcription factor [Bryobacterales bacterium]